MRLVLFLIAIFVATPVQAQGYRVVASYPHDSGAFTEGLFYLDGALYESTGGEGQSDIRKVRLADGKVLRQFKLPPQYFGEGIVHWKEQILSLTWQHGIGFRWRRQDFRKIGSFRYEGEGWALTQDGTHIYMSDGTPQLRVMDPENFKEIRRITVTDGDQPVSRLNELEYVRGEILANVWLTSRIARIDPATGKVKGWVDLSSLAKTQQLRDPDSVLNGIAYDAESDRLFVTGKNWPQLYEIVLTGE